MKIGIIGFGNMGRAIAIGLHDSYELVIYNRTNYKIDIDANVVTTMQDVIDQSQIVFIATKPHQYHEVLTDFNLGDTTIISIGAGITSEFMNRYCNNFVLTMPNTSAINKKSITSVVKSKTKTYQLVIDICKTFGDVIEIDESQLSNYTVLFGSSPAFFYYFVDSFSKQFNIDSSLIAKHFIAASEMLNIDEANVLCKNVCSEGGVTIAGINSLENNNFDKVIKTAIDASIQRYIEMEIK